MRHSRCFSETFLADVTICETKCKTIRKEQKNDVQTAEHCRFTWSPRSVNRVCFSCACTEKEKLDVLRFKAPLLRNNDLSVAAHLRSLWSDDPLSKGHPRSIKQGLNTQTRTQTTKLTINHELINLYLRIRSRYVST